MDRPNVEPIAEDTATPAALPCPYPDCVGFLSGAELAGELSVCGVCHRPGARCPRHGRHGRCRALNRPLARFCRQCRQELDDGWAEAAWLRDLDDGRPAAKNAPRLSPPLDQAERAQWVLCLDDYLPADQGAASLLEVGGWLWLGTAGGSWLMADPFSDVNGNQPLAFGPLWPGGGRQAVRAVGGGLWLAPFSRAGVKAVHLLALDDPRRDDYQPLEVWQPAAGEELLAAPVLLRVGRHRPERVAAWLVRTAAGLTLCAAALDLALAAGVTVARFPLDDGGEPLPAADGGAVLRPVPLDERDGVLLATALGVWLLRLPAELPGQPTPLAALPLLRHLQQAGLNDVPGLAFLPAESGAVVGAGGAGSCGTVLVAAGAAACEELWAVPFNPHGPTASPICHGPVGVPLDVVAARGRQQVLCLAGTQLLLCDQDGRHSAVANHDLLSWAQHFTAFGRFLVCWGRDPSRGRPRWFAGLIDLEQEDALIDVTVRDAPLAPPVLLGRHVFTVEQVAAQGRTRRWLTRRRLG
jgi:hypothetical protein